MSLLYGLVTGVLFGVLLQRAEVLRFDKQVGALRLKDMTIFKFMLSAIVVGAVGIYLLKDLGLIGLSLKSTSIGAQAVGGAAVRHRLGSIGILSRYSRRRTGRGPDRCRLGYCRYAGRWGASCLGLSVSEK